MSKIIWICWWGGNALIFLALLRVVPPAVGWTGFVIAFFAFLAPGLVRRYRRRSESTPHDAAADGGTTSNAEEDGG
jgi:membrane protein implicated in regulation of membrane protease activity